MDESSMTGESVTVKKTEKTPFLLSGTQMSEGNMTMLVIAVGSHSEWGITYKKLQAPIEAFSSLFEVYSI